MKKIFFLVLLYSLLFTACGSNVPDPTAAPTVSATTLTPMERVFDDTETRYHVLGKVIETSDDYCMVHIMGVYPEYGRDTYILVNTELLAAEKGEEVSIQFVGELAVDYRELRYHNVDEKYIALLPEDGIFIVPEKIEKANTIENDGIVRGKLAAIAGSVIPEGRTEAEIAESPFVVCPFADEEEGDVIRVCFYLSSVEITGELELDCEVTLYYDTDTYEVYRVETAEK